MLTEAELNAIIFTVRNPDKKALIAYPTPNQAKLGFEEIKKFMKDMLKRMEVR